MFFPLLPYWSEQEKIAVFLAKTKENRRPPMQQVTPSVYRVEAGESITLEIEAIGVGNFSIFAVDGRRIDSVPGTEPKRFEPFTVSVGPGLTQFGRVEVDFPPEASDDDARYQLFLIDEDGERFTGPDILKSDVTGAVGLEFRR
jgi:hypothetical protein